MSLANSPRHGSDRNAAANEINFPISEIPADNAALRFAIRGKTDVIGFLIQGHTISMSQPDDLPTDHSHDMTESLDRIPALNIGIAVQRNVREIRSRKDAVQLTADQYGKRELRSLKIPRLLQPRVHSPEKATASARQWPPANESGRGSRPRPLILTQFRRRQTNFVIPGCGTGSACNAVSQVRLAGNVSSLEFIIWSHVSALPVYATVRPMIAVIVLMATCFNSLTGLPPRMHCDQVGVLLHVRIDRGLSRCRAMTRLPLMLYPPTCARPLGADHVLGDVVARLLAANGGTCCTCGRRWGT